MGVPKGNDHRRENSPTAAKTINKKDLICGDEGNREGFFKGVVNLRYGRPYEKVDTPKRSLSSRR